MADDDITPIEPIEPEENMDDEALEPDEIIPPVNPEISMDEKRRRISWIRTAILRMVSICERSAAVSDPGSRTSNSEFPRTDVSELFSVCRMSSM